jgi:NRAMP (natural resistance-associated macrophage protein)-like metal ion transporter
MEYQIARDVCLPYMNGTCGARDSSTEVRAKHQSRRAGSNRFIRFFARLGPGLITGAADDDPSAIATYSIAGAQLGTALLWTAFLTWPLMAAVQMMCTRIGVVTGKGLAGALRERYPKPLIALLCGALLVVNTVTIGADLSAMADVTEMVTAINSHYFVFLFGIGIAAATIHLRYHQIVDILKWLTLALLAYVMTAIVLRPEWRPILRATFIPSWPGGPGGWATLVAVLGTTISPYIFFWQASHEMEVQKRTAHPSYAWTDEERRSEMRTRAFTVGAGSFFSNVVMYFIILTAALTFHLHGVTNIETSAQAAGALAPLAGRFAEMLFAVGVIGAGLLAIPTLTGSAAYALAETFEWNHGLNERFAAARAFYLVIILSTLIGIVLDFADVNPLRALFWAAAINGLLAQFLLVGILLIACDPIIMKGHCSSLLSRSVVSLTALLMIGAAIGMFVF